MATWLIPPLLYDGAATPSAAWRSFPTRTSALPAPWPSRGASARGTIVGHRAPLAALLSYILVLTAMVVHAREPGGAAREVSILFAALMGRAPAARGRSRPPRGRRRGHGAGDRRAGAGLEFASLHGPTEMPSFTTTAAWQALLSPRDSSLARRVSELWDEDPGAGRGADLLLRGPRGRFLQHASPPRRSRCWPALARERGLPAMIEKLFGRRAHHSPRTARSCTWPCAATST